MGKEGAGSSNLSSSNPFSALGNKKKTGGMTAHTQHHKDTPKPRAPEDKVGSDKTKAPQSHHVHGKSEPPAKKDAMKDNKVSSAPPAASEKELSHREQKDANKQTDRADRSGKGNQVRKGGQGTGGWEDNWNNGEAAAAGWGDVVPSPNGDDVDASPTVGADGAVSPAAVAEDEDDKAMTLEEYQAKKAAAGPISGLKDVSVRVVEKPSALQQVKKEDEADTLDGFQAAKKKEAGSAKKQQGTPAGGKDKKGKKEANDLLNFTTPDPRDDGGRGRGGKGGGRRGEGRGGGRGGKGGKGGKGGQGGGGHYGGADSNVNWADATAFPTLGGGQ